MRLNKLQVRGFQSFANSGELEFLDGINLLIGQNNAGKSALLRAMRGITDDRHRTPAAWENVRLPVPEAPIEVTVSGEDLRSYYLSHDGQYLAVPADQNYLQFCQDFFAQSEFKLRLISRPGEWTGDYPAHGLFVAPPVPRRHAVQIHTKNGELSYSHSSSKNDSIAKAAHYTWKTKMFYFTAERMTIGESGPGHAERLEPNASNLPAVLLTLSGDRGNLFNKLTEHLRQIFSTVGNLSVRPKPQGNNIEIRVWPTEDMERVELSFPLNSSGTGVAQVIAILTAVMTTENSVIMIDEINSFLHPAAIKALLRIIQTEYSDHQYIISTHAPEVVSFSNPSTIHLIKRDGYESSVRRLNLRRVDEFRELADHLGVSMSDVFAADHVVWVEGPTEELCFPLLYENRMGQPLPRATVFTSVSATGDFSAKERSKKLIFDIYRRLSAAATPLDVTVAFSFDSENLSSRAKADLKRESDGGVHFLPRRHIECYLISPAALFEYIVAKDLHRLDYQAALTEAEVTAKLFELAASAAFINSQWSGDLFSERWLTQVDAAKLIARAVSELTQARVEFRKKNDTLALLQFVQQRTPALVEPLADYVVRLVQTVSKEGNEA